MMNLRSFVVLVVVTCSAFASSAETGCPGNVASLPFQFVNRHQILVLVSANRSGPYKFLLDTGAQTTILDSSLANELHLPSSGSVRVVGVGLIEAGSFAKLQNLEVGVTAVADQRVVVSPLNKRSGIRGVLGMDFLMHFDLVIDYVHKIICLDENGVMEATLRGPRTPLLRAAQTAIRSGMGPSLIVSARLTDGRRPVRLMLDSGAEIAYIYGASDCMNIGPLAQRPWASGFTTVGENRLYSILPLQSVTLGSVKVEQVPFITIAGYSNSRAAELDGLLPMRLFRWVFVSWRDQIVVFGR